MFTVVHRKLNEPVFPTVHALGMVCALAPDKMTATDAQHFTKYERKKNSLKSFTERACFLHSIFTTLFQPLPISIFHPWPYAPKEK